MKEGQTPQHWPQLSLLDVLRPAPGWHTTDAVLSTYSLDLVVMVSALLALTGRDNLEGSGSKVGLASAIDHFRPSSGRRLSVLVQSGRISTPRTTSTVLALLDRFVKEVKRDQRTASWHAKAALVRFETSAADSETKAVEWRLWIGSRNLSRDMSWDSGLVLTSTKDKSGTAIDGLHGLAHALFTEAEWPKGHRNALLKELEKMQWHTPRGIQINAITWLDGSQPWRPTLPKNPDAVTVITPFFDRPALNQLAQFVGDAEKRLLTTAPELDRRITNTHRDLQGWEVLCLDSSEQAEVTIEEPGIPDTDSTTDCADERGNDDELVPLGLHAKIIASRVSDRAHLLLGSANVTQRAWKHNTEIVVELEGKSELWEGIDALLGQASYALTETTADKTESPRERLDALRNALCNLNLSQRIKGPSLEVSAEKALRLAFSDKEWVTWRELGARLEIAPLAAPSSEYVNWPVEQAHVDLPARDVSLAGDTEFMQLRLVCTAETAGISEPATITWMQRIPMVPELDQSRDKRILAGYLSPHQFLNWIHGMLEGYETDQEPWDRPSRGRNSSTSHQNRVSAVEIPTIESLLKAWQRDHNSLHEVAATLERYFDKETLQQNTTNQDDVALATITGFRQQLQQMVQVLGNKKR